METLAFVGPSGTGKSHQALELAQSLDADAIIDDGLFIHRGKIVAGLSAKREDYVMKAVRRAIFADPGHAREVREGIANIEPERVLILGTSDKMIIRITETLKLPLPVRTIYIEDIASADQIAAARVMRHGQGKHVVPVPAIEMKRRFSGYVIETLEHFITEINPWKDAPVMERTIVRPRFSYLGKLIIAETVFKSMALYQAKCMPGCLRVHACDVRQNEYEVIFHLQLTVAYGIVIPDFSTALAESISEEVLRMTGKPVLFTEITVKAIRVERQGEGDDKTILRRGIERVGSQATGSGCQSGGAQSTEK